MFEALEKVFDGTIIILRPVHIWQDYKHFVNYR